MVKSFKSRAGMAAAAGIVGASMLLAACSSSDSSTPGSGTSSSGGNTDPIKVGFLTGVTGAAAPGNKDGILGAQARIKVLNDAGGINGRQIELVTADDTSTPDGNLAAVKRLIDQEEVFAIITDTPFFFGGYRYTVQKGVPTYSFAFDGPEWSDPANNNLFSYSGAPPNPQAATTVLGEFLKKKGGTALGTVGYAQSQSSSDSANNAGVSARAAGMTAPYINISVPFGGVDFNAITLAMKDKGVDSLYLPIIVNSSTAILAAAKQNGLSIKAALVAAGYGRSTLADTASLAANEGAYFLPAIAPFELQTEATKKVQSALEAVGYVGDPDFPVAVGYMAADLLITGLNQPGATDSQEALITATRALKYDGAGVIGDPSKPIDMSIVPNPDGAPPGWCQYYVQLTGGKFVPDPDASPICGTTITQ